MASSPHPSLNISRAVLENVLLWEALVPSTGGVAAVRISAMIRLDVAKSVVYCVN